MRAEKAARSASKFNELLIEDVSACISMYGNLYTAYLGWKLSPCEHHGQ